jgi:hypothetical protein
MDAKTRNRLIALHGVMLGSDQIGERENARDAMKRILEDLGLTWNDLGPIVGSASHVGTVDDAAAWADVAEPAERPALAPAGEILEGVLAVLKDHVEVGPHEVIAIALWVMHTFVFDKFAVTPRLMLESPVRGCGKTTVLVLLEALGRCSLRFDGVSPAGLYRLIERDHPTVLCDEVDTYGLKGDGTLRQILNSGHRRGGRILRCTRDGDRQQFSTFAPVALAAIGTETLPLPLQQRSIVIHMKRAARTLKRLDEATMSSLGLICSALHVWAKRVTLDLDPKIPPELRNRAADNWRPLIAIADLCGDDYGRQAREAAIAMSGDTFLDEDPVVALLKDIRRVFDARGVDRISSRELVDELVGPDDSPWDEWRGPIGDQQPHRLTQSELARLLRPFHIKPRSMWPKKRASDAKSTKGYQREHFKDAWQAYCQSANERPQWTQLRVVEA